MRLRRKKALPDRISAGPFKLLPARALRLRSFGLVVDTLPRCLARRRGSQSSVVRIAATSQTKTQAPHWTQSSRLMLYLPFSSLIAPI